MRFTKQEKSWIDEERKFEAKCSVEVESWWDKIKRFFRGDKEEIKRIDQPTREENSVQYFNELAKMFEVGGITANEFRNAIVKFQNAKLDVDPIEKFRTIALDAMCNYGKSGTLPEDVEIELHTES